jgi:two-component system, OmpR family, catabolic regulation response regulator CreB
MRKNDTILLVEDEASIAVNVVHALKQDGFQVVHVTTGKEALQQGEKNQHSLALVDVGLPDQSGFEVGRHLISHHKLPVIFLTARGEEIDRVSGLELGADDYLVKPVSLRELTARVRAVLRRIGRADDEETVRSQDLASGFSYDSRRQLISFQGKELKLSKTEFSLLKVLAENPGHVFSRERLMDRAWEEPEMSLERTVDSHIKALRQKLKEVTSDEIIITHRGFGYSIRT